MSLPLSEKLLALLRALAYWPDSEWEVNILPFGSVYWSDEMPPLADLVDRPEDTLIIHSMFGMRLKIWDGEALDPQDQRLWDAVQSEVPNRPLFKRLKLSEEQKLARQEAEQQVERAFEP